MKKIYLTAGLCLITMVASAQWLTDMSCNKKAGEIANKAVAHFVNLETSLAVGMADAALMVDDKCGTAKLVLVNSALGGEFGSRAEKVKALDTKKFTDEEKAWYAVLSAPDSENEKVRKEIAAEYPEVPLFAYWASVIDDNGKDGLADYVKTFPDYASPAYNVMSYRYAQGYYGEPDMDKAIETVKKVFLTHDGPNAHDSMAEHYALMGDYDSAFKQQVMALDYAAGPASGYGFNATTYYRHNDQQTITDTLEALTKRRIAFQMKNDSENLKKFYSEKAGMIACNSNMEACEFLATWQDEPPMANWKRWDVSDWEIHFSPDMRMAITTFNNDGEYTLVGSEKPVAYKTRASEVWIDDNGWKLMHSNFAPLAIGSGIPKTEKSR